MKLQNKILLFSVLLSLLWTITSLSQKDKTIDNAIDLSIKNPNFQKIFDGTLIDNDIYWLGEAHGTKVNYEVAIKYFKYLIEEVGIDYFIIENSRLTEILLNEYLETGDENKLKKVIENHKDTFAYNKDKYNFFQDLYQIYTLLPDSKKFRFISIDIEQTFPSSHKYVSAIVKQTEKGSSLLKEFKESRENPETKKGSYTRYYTKLKNYIQQDWNYIEKTVEKPKELQYLVNNFLYNIKAQSVKDKHFNIIRDSLMYENFKKRDKELDFASHKSFAFFGTDHCYKKENKNEEKWIASLIENKRPDIKQNSTAILYSKCEFMLPEWFIPKFFRLFFKRIPDSKYFVEKSRNNDNLIIKYKDIKYLKKNKVSNQTLWKVKGLNQDWDFIYKKKKEFFTSDYIDNIILITNSKHCVPFSIK